MDAGENSITKIETRRVELERNVARLRASLRHWQAWEIEYEGMKEEILKLGDKPSLTQINKTAESSGEVSIDSDKVLLTRKEKGLIVRDEKGVTRKPDQILNLLSRRTEYIQQNVRTVGSMLDAARKELVASEVLTEAKALNEEGLPLIDILEELDEDGNVISSSTSVPGETVPNAVEAIEKAAGLTASERGGKNELSTEKESPRKTLRGSLTESSPEDSLKNSRPAEVIEPRKNRQTPNHAETAKQAELTGKAELSGKYKSTSPNIPESPRKQAFFANEVEVETASDSARDHKASEQKLLQEIADREADEIERQEMAESVIPDDESPEDALVRRQMIQYNLEEVGAIVAEIDIQDDILSQSEHDSDIEMEITDGEEPYVEEEDEEEDDFGRTTKSKPLEAAYIQRMQALSNKMRASPVINIGPTTAVKSKDTGSHAILNTPPKSPKVASSRKKGVRFAEDLHIQESPVSIPEAQNGIDEDPEWTVANLLAASSAISGKPIAQLPASSAVTVPGQSTATSSKKPSRFKAARAQASTNASIAASLNSVSKSKSTPKPNPQKILADTLVERPFNTSLSSAPSPSDTDTDIFEAELLKSEMSTAYHHLRNRQVHREGGFVRNDENGEPVEFASTEPSHNGGGDALEPKKKLSKFKAARLGLQ